MPKQNPYKKSEYVKEGEGQQTQPSQSNQQPKQRDFDIDEILRKIKENPENE